MLAYDVGAIFMRFGAFSSKEGYICTRIDEELKVVCGMDVAFWFRFPFLSSFDATVNKWRADDMDVYFEEFELAFSTFLEKECEIKEWFLLLPSSRCRKNCVLQLHISAFDLKYNFNFLIRSKNR